MVGNDIVDFEEAKRTSNWQRPRFLDKLFTQEEYLFIQNADNPFEMIWRLWSMKEASYKLYIQTDPRRFYNPKKFQCAIKNNKGFVRYYDFKCQVITRITSNYILSEATLKESRLTSKVIPFNTSIKNKSDYLRQKLKLSVSKKFAVSEDQLQLNKDKFGIPTIVSNETKIYISLTHHGNYGAFAIA